MKSLSQKVVILTVLILSAVSFAGTYSGGGGGEGNPYQIATKADLLALGATTADYGKFFILTADIDLDPNLPGGQVFATAVIAPDANVSSPGFQGISFTGVFDGAGHEISNLTITNGTGNGNLGLFGDVNAGEIKNLGLENINIASGGGSPFASVFFGGMAGSNYGSISNCFSTGTVNVGINSQYIGGLVGTSAGSISNCSSAASVIGTHEPHSLGGLEGRNAGSISNCSSTGTVNGGIGSKGIGGLAGDNYQGSISDCFSTGDVNGGSGSYALGGLVGYNGSSISNSYSTGTVTGGDYSNRLGGLAGDNNGGSISSCFATGAVTCGYESSSLGGLVGWNSGSISNCFASGSVTGNSSVGGLVGDNYQGKVIRCYSAGKPTGTSSVGGLSGFKVTGGNYEDTGNFWDTDTSGKLTSAMGIGKTTALMMTLSTFTDANGLWDFLGEATNGTDDYWRMCVDGVDYPRLTWEYIQDGDFACPDGVGFDDLQRFGDDWLLTYSTPFYGADANGDKTVNFLDFAILADNWLAGI